LELTEAPSLELNAAPLEMESFALFEFPALEPLCALLELEQIAFLAVGPLELSSFLPWKLP
jgi:hypothetical protein